jgi:hypothetical protein
MFVAASRENEEFRAALLCARGKRVRKRDDFIAENRKFPRLEKGPMVCFV